MENYNLYIITNIINQKKYVGITKVGYAKRFETHKDNAKRFYERSQRILLYIAMGKHGFDYFEIEFLSEGNNWEHLKELEIEAIKKNKTYVGDDDSWGYNQTRGGDGSDGYKWTEEQLAAHSRPPQTEEIREKKRNHPNSKPWLGKNLSLEHREKVRQARIGTTRSAASKLKQSMNTKHGKDNHKSKPVLIDSILYETMTSAMKALEITEYILLKQLNDPNVLNYQWIKKEY